MACGDNAEQVLVSFTHTHTTLTFNQLLHYLNRLAHCCYHSVTTDRFSMAGDEEEQTYRMDKLTNFYRTHDPDR